MAERKVLKNCQICGALYVGLRRQKYCCEKCREKARSNAAKLMSEQRKEDEKRKLYKVNPIMAIAWAARQQGMTYGAFVVTLKEGDEERICNEYVEYWEKRKGEVKHVTE